VRVLGKTKAEMASSDLTAHAAEKIAAANFTDLYILGRRGPVEASFTSTELAELGRLERVRPIVKKSDLPDAIPAGLDPNEARVKEKNLSILHEFADRTDEKPIRLHFLFNAAPETIIGSSRVEGLKIRGGVTLEVGTVISAIGYRTAVDGDLPQSDAQGVIANTDGRIEPGLYVVGWAKRGPSGTIPTNRAEAKTVADLLLADYANDTSPAKEGSAALDAWLTGRGVNVMDWTCWKRIEAAEIAAAIPGSPRAKLAAWDELRKHK
jgi:NADPH-dependent glutamate synthase beta subunit-like oxidoreductase